MWSRLKHWNKRFVIKYCLKMFLNIFHSISWYHCQTHRNQIRSKLGLMTQNTWQKKEKKKNPCFLFFPPNLPSLIFYFLLQTNINSSLVGVLTCIFPKKVYSEHQFPQEKRTASENQVSKQWVCFLSMCFPFNFFFLLFWAFRNTYTA